jgi:hypothetical protein
MWEFSTWMRCFCAVKAKLRGIRDVDHIDGLAFEPYVYTACHLLWVRHNSTAYPKCAPEARSPQPRSARPARFRSITPSDEGFSFACERRFDSSVFELASIGQSMIRHEQASITAARYRFPSGVGCLVMSVSHSRTGWSTWRPLRHQAGGTPVRCRH